MYSVAEKSVWSQKINGYMDIYAEFYFQALVMKFTQTQVDSLNSVTLKM